MAEKKTGKYTSKGERKANKKISNAVRRDKDPFEVAAAKHRAFAKGFNVVLTIPNPNDKETNKPFIRVNAKDVYGDYRNFGRPQASNKGNE